MIESIPYDKVNPDKIKKKTEVVLTIKNKLTCFQIYPEKDLACKNKTPLYKTQYKENFVEYEKSFQIKKGNY